MNNAPAPVAAKPVTRKKLEQLVWTNTHRDFRGKLPDGTKTVLHLMPAHGTCIVEVAGLTTDVLLGKLPSRVRSTISEVVS
jgi:hypothetical protein